MIKMERSEYTQADVYVPLFTGHVTFFLVVGRVETENIDSSSSRT